MKWMFVLLVAHILAPTALAHKSANNNNSRCIKMTKKAEAEIERMIHKIGDFITSLADAHYKYAIPFVKFEIAGKDEAVDNEIKVHVSINDCGEQQPRNEEEDELEFLVDTQRTPEKQRSPKTREGGENQDTSSSPKYTQNFENCTKVDEAKWNAKENQNGGILHKPREDLELMILNLEHLPEPLVKKMDKKRGNSPLVVYIQHRGQNQTDHVFLNRK